MRHPAKHGNLSPFLGEAGHLVAPLVVVQVNPFVVGLHVIVVHVVVHRHVWQVGHVEVSEAFGEERVERDLRIRLDDLPPCVIEILHVVLGDGTPLVADLLGLDTRRFHRVGVLLEVRFGHLVEVEDGSEFLGRVLGNALRIVFRHAGDLLQLDATAFDRIAADDGTAVHQIDEAAMDEHGRQHQCDHVRLPTFTVVDDGQQRGEQNDVPRVFGADQHDAARHEQCRQGTFAQFHGLAVDGGQRLDMRHMQLIPHAEPPDEREREQRRFGQ